VRSDDELKAAIQDSWYWQFYNWNHDFILEGPANSDEAECERILELLKGAEIHIVWPSADMPEVFRVVNEDGSFAKPKSKGYRAKPGEIAWSTAKGLYTTEGRAKAAIRGGIGQYIERGKVTCWERMNND